MAIGEFVREQQAYGMDLDVIRQVLGLDRQQERTEPLETAKVSAYPEEVDFPQSRLLLRVVHAVPDALEDAGEGRDANTCADEQSDLVLEDVFRRASEGPVDVYPRQDSTDRGIHVIGLFRRILVHADDCRVLRPFLAVFPTTLFEVAAQGLAECFGEVADAADVDRDVVLFGCAGEGKGVVLPDGDLGAAEEDILPCAGLGFRLFDLDLYHVARMLNHLAHKGSVAAAYLTEDAFNEIGESTVLPESPEDSSTITEGRDVRFDHTEGAVNGPEDEENDE